MMKRAIIAILTVTALITVTTAIATSAATSWKTFGSAYSYARGSAAYADATVHSTTKRDPLYVRAQLSDGSRTKRTNVSWDIFCWRESDFQTWTRGTNNKYYLPKTKTWDPPNWVDYCEVHASAYHFDTGYVKVKVQAKYPG